MNKNMNYYRILTRRRRMRLQTASSSLLQNLCILWIEGKSPMRTTGTFLFCTPNLMSCNAILGAEKPTM